MADQNDAPEGLDEFLAADDPQATRAAQGAIDLVNSPVVAAVGQQIDQNLQNYKQTVDAAIAGDPVAKARLQQQNMSMAMGTIQGPNGPLLEASQAGYAEKLDEAKNLMNSIYESMQRGEAKPEQLQAATQRYNAMLDIAQRHAAQRANPRPTKAYADGGEVSSDEPPGLDQFANGPSPASSEPEGLSEFIAPEEKEAQYGTAGQQAITGLEGAAEGATFGLSDYAEKALGVNPEDIRGRAEINPGEHALGQVGGLAASSFIPGVGAANLLRAGGEGVAGAVGLGKVGGSLLNQVARDTVAGAFEAGLFQGGEEIHKLATNDPNAGAGAAISDMGLAAIMGGVFSGGAGAFLRKINPVAPAFVSEVDRPAVDAGDFKASIENSNLLNEGQKSDIIGGLGDEKPNADEIRAAAKEIGAPVLEGQVSASKWVQKAEDALINGAPTYSGIKRAGLYQQGYDMAKQAVTDVIGDESPQYSKAELGNLMKSSITSQIQEESVPINGMYNYIKQFHDIIPVSQDAVQSVAKDLGNMQEIRLAPSAPGSSLAKNVINELGNLKTVDDIKSYRSSLFDRVPVTASPGEKRTVAIISDKLKELENNSIEQTAKRLSDDPASQQMVNDLVAQRKQADAAYKPFIKKVQTLSEQLGKGKVYGAQDAINFMNDLTPEQVTQRLFSKNNSEFLNFFSRNFPDQMQLMRQYQRGILRESSMTPEGELSLKKLFNNVNKMEPEIQKSLFSKDELGKLEAAETYVRSFPPNFNPSGTAHQSAMREFFHSPMGAAISNARDLGIEQFIKGVSSSPQVVGATSIAKATVNGINTAGRAIKSIFNPDKVTMPIAIGVSQASRDKLDKLVQEYAQNPDKMTSVNDNNPVDAYKEPFAAISGRAFNYLNSIRPQEKTAGVLGSPMKPTMGEKAKYERALTIAQQPLTVLKHIQKGTLTSSDIGTLNAIYPNTYNALAAEVNKQMIEHVNKGKSVPYVTRQSLSLFTGQPLDATMTPQAIISAQPLPAVPQPNPGVAAPKPKRGTNSLQKFSQQYQTPGQSSESRNQRRD